MTKTFTCENCHQEFNKGWSDEEQEEEMEKNFPGLSEDDRAEVCDDCYKEMMAWAKKEQLPPFNN